VGDSFVRRSAWQVLTWSGVALGSVVVSWNVTPLLALLVFFIVVLGLAVAGLIQACRWQRCLFAVVGLGAFVGASLLLGQFEDQIHFFLLRPLYALEIAFTKAGPDGYTSRTWNWSEALNFGSGIVVYNNKPHALLAGDTKELNCGKWTREMVSHFYVVRTVCWS
jgi:hypothetical protein